MMTETQILLAGLSMAVAFLGWNSYNLVNMKADIAAVKEKLDRDYQAARDLLQVIQRIDSDVHSIIERVAILEERDRLRNDHD